MLPFATFRAEIIFESLQFRSQVVLINNKSWSVEACVSAAQARLVEEMT